jgi:hypothetical protein
MISSPTREALRALRDKIGAEADRHAGRGNPQFVVGLIRAVEIIDRELDTLLAQLSSASPETQDR